MHKFIIALSFLFPCIYQASAQLNIQLRSNLPYSPVDLSNIGGYADSSGNEYALVGTSNGLSIVDVTNPVAPVQIFDVAGVHSNWREVKTWLNYAYVTNENGDGLQIINLGYLPDSVQVTQWHGDSTVAGIIITIHALHIDNGFIYLFGCGNGSTSAKIFNGAAIICDLNADPRNPHYLGHTTDFGTQSQSYVHDGFVLNDTLWAGHISAGAFRVWNCADKSSPVLLATRSTTTNFTHNTWLSDNHQVLFTTDENQNSFLTAYDVSDLGNISELSRFQTAPGSNAIVHNTHILNDYAITSWYTEGVVITDVSRPDNPVEVGKYDTYLQSGSFDGCWGVYPFLPSGNLVASDIQNGLFVLTPTYIRGCYLEGTVVDSVTNGLLQGVSVTILTTGINKLTNSFGEYKAGTVTSGSYSITFSKNGYISKTINGISLSNGIVTNLNIQLVALPNFILNGIVLDSASGSPLIAADVWFTNADYDYQAKTNALGEFSFPGFYDGTYNVTIGKWGSQTVCETVTVPFNAGADTFHLARGYMDDFTFDNGWTVAGTSFNLWERALPIGTFYLGQPSNPGNDVNTDCGDYCFVTDNGVGSVNANDVDNGNTILTSPQFDPTYLSNPVLEYSRWFFDAGGVVTPNDTMKVFLSDGITNVLVETMCLSACGAGNGTWVSRSFPINGLIVPSAAMRISVVIADDVLNHTVEGGFDNFRVTGTIITGSQELPANPEFTAFPNPSKENFTITYNVPFNSSSYELKIMDISGRIVSNFSLNNTFGTIETGVELSAGIYFVSIHSQGYSSPVIRLIKTR